MERCDRALRWPWNSSVSFRYARLDATVETRVREAVLAAQLLHGYPALGLFEKPDALPSLLKAMFTHIRWQASYVTCFSKEPRSHARYHA
jgi:hypothetical protein